MKRTAFRRKDLPPARPARQWEGGVVTPRAPALCLVEPARAIVAVPKEVLLRSRPYRMWVASWPCDLCGIEKLSQAAHENLGKALQGKVCDSRIFSACIAHGEHAGCHYNFDNYIDISRDEARELGARLSARTREKAEAAGWEFDYAGGRIVAP